MTRILRLLLPGLLAMAVGCTRAGFDDQTQKTDGKTAQPDLKLTPASDAMDAALDAEVVAVDTTLPNDLPTNDCRTPLGLSALALYRFETITAVGVLADETGKHPGALVGAKASLVAGPSGCGKALSFLGFPSDIDQPTTYGAIDHSPAWNLQSGSISFWVRFDRAPGQQGGILSRDAGDQNQPGHFSIMRARDGRIIARLQRLKDETPQQYLLCSKIVSTGSWHRVRFDFGVPHAELYVDGKLAQETAKVATRFGSKIETNACGVTGPAGIAGNQNPWVIGALNSRSADGTINSPHSALAGAIDNLLISRARQAKP